RGLLEWTPDPSPAASQTPVMVPPAELDDLLKRLADDNPLARVAAAAELERRHCRDGPAVAALTAALSDDDPRVAVAATRPPRLGGRGPAAGAAGRAAGLGRAGGGDVLRPGGAGGGRGRPLALPVRAAPVRGAGLRPGRGGGDGGAARGGVGGGAGAGAGPA